MWFLVFTPTKSFALCATPTAAIGALDFQTSVFKYCDGTNWQAIGGASSLDGLSDVATNYTDMSIAIGQASGLSAGATYDTYVGVAAGSSTTTGDRNTFVGFAAGNKVTTSVDNTFIGYRAGAADVGGHNNTAVGSYAMEGFTPGVAFNYNVALGYYALRGTLGSSTGERNTAIGTYSGQVVTTGNDNTFVGYNSGSAVTTGYSNVILGSNTGSTIAAATNTIIISDGAGLERMRIDSAGKVGIGTTSPLNQLTLMTPAAATQMRMGTTGALGGGFVAGDSGGLYMSGSMEYVNGTGWVARHSAASSLQLSSGGFQLYGDTGLTNGNTFTPTARVTIDSSGNVGIGTSTPGTSVTVNGPIALKAPATVNAATYTVAAGDSSLIFTTTTCTVTLPAAATFPGRILYVKNITANAVSSNASNVYPLGTATLGTAILGASAGKFAMLQSDGTNWVIMMAN